MRNIYLIVFAVAGCGGEGTVAAPASIPSPSPIPVSMADMAVAPQPSMPPAATPDMAVPPTTGPQTVTVMVGANGGMSFSPAQVTIHAGDTVHWMWPGGGLPHTVTSGTVPNADGQFCSNGGTQSAAACTGLGYATAGPATFDHTFPTAGTFPYFCEVHGAMMTGTVTVQ
jgi:plastocyanin